MALKTQHYDTAAMLLHWGIGILVFSVGLTSPFLDHRTWPARSTFHNVGGFLALVITLNWFGYRTTRPELPHLAMIGAREQNLMSLADSALYVLPVLVPVSGIIYLFALGDTLQLRSLQHWQQPRRLSTEAVQRLGLLHHALGALLVVVVAGGHSLHAVWHHVKLRDGLLARMLPWH